MNQQQFPTLKSRRFTLFDRLYTRFALEPPPAGDTPEPGVYPQLAPVIDIADLYPMEARFTTLDIQASVGTFVPAFTVPVGQRYHIKYLTKPATSANCILLLVSPDGTSGLTQTINLSATGTALALVTSSQVQLKLDAGWQIGLSTTGNAGDSARTLKSLYIKETLD